MGWGLMSWCHAAIPGPALAGRRQMAARNPANLAFLETITVSPKATLVAAFVFPRVGGRWRRGQQQHGKTGDKASHVALVLGNREVYRQEGGDQRDRES